MNIFWSKKQNHSLILNTPTQRVFVIRCRYIGHCVLVDVHIIRKFRFNYISVMSNLSKEREACELTHVLFHYWILLRIARREKIHQLVESRCSVLFSYLIVVELFCSLFGPLDVHVFIILQSVHQLAYLSCQPFWADHH